MFSFFRKKPAASSAPATSPTVELADPSRWTAAEPSIARAEPAPAAVPQTGSLIGTAVVEAIEIPTAPAVAPERQGWLDRLTAGLRKTGSSISQVFTGGQIDEAFYEELETALLMADTGVKATQHLLDEVRRRVQASGASRPVQAKNILVDALTQLLRPLEQELVIGEHEP